jgi:hypothetical protein
MINGINYLRQIIERSYIINWLLDYKEDPKDQKVFTPINESDIMKFREVMKAINFQIWKKKQNEEAYHFRAFKDD